MIQPLENKTTLIIISLVIIIIGVFIIGQMINSEDTWKCYNDKWIKQGEPANPKPMLGCGEDSITNFDECLTNGYPVMETYPRQCRAGGLTYIEQIGPPGRDECFAKEGRWEPISISNNEYGCNEKKLINFYDR